MAGIPFPRAALEKIKHYVGNQTCCDCDSLDVDWGNINHGTLNCLACAGKHRHFGVKVSFIRSIYMDTWNEFQLEMMKQGGNGQLKEYFKKHKIDQLSLIDAYNSDMTEKYRIQLKERVTRILSGEIPSEPYRNNIITQMPSSSSSSSSSRRSSAMHIHSSSSLSTTYMTPIHITKLQATFQEGSLGLTLSKNSYQQAIVTKLEIGGQAQLQGIHIGDHIIGVDEYEIENYIDIIYEIKNGIRPLTLLLKRYIYPSSSSSSVCTTTTTNNNNNNNNNMIQFKNILPITAAATATSKTSYMTPQKTSDDDNNDILYNQNINHCDSGITTTSIGTDSKVSNNNHMSNSNSSNVNTNIRNTNTTITKPSHQILPITIKIVDKVHSNHTTPRIPYLDLNMNKTPSTNTKQLKNGTINTSRSTGNTSLPPTHDTHDLHSIKDLSTVFQQLTSYDDSAGKESSQSSYSSRPLSWKSNQEETYIKSVISDRFTYKNRISDDDKNNNNSIQNNEDTTRTSVFSQDVIDSINDILRSNSTTTTYNNNNNNNDNDNNNSNNNITVVNDDETVKPNVTINNKIIIHNLDDTYNYQPSIDSQNIQYHRKIHESTTELLTSQSLSNQHINKDIHKSPPKTHIISKINTDFDTYPTRYNNNNNNNNNNSNSTESKDFYESFDDSFYLMSPDSVVPNPSDFHMKNDSTSPKQRHSLGNSSEYDNNINPIIDELIDIDTITGNNNDKKDDNSDDDDDDDDDDDNSTNSSDTSTSEHYRNTDHHNPNKNKNNDEEELMDDNLYIDPYMDSSPYICDDGKDVDYDDDAVHNISENIGVPRVYSFDLKAVDTTDVYDTAVSPLPIYDGSRKRQHESEVNDINNDITQLTLSKTNISVEDDGNKNTDISNKLLDEIVISETNNTQENQISPDIDKIDLTHPLYTTSLVKRRPSITLSIVIPDTARLTESIISCPKSTGESSDAQDIYRLSDTFTTSILMTTTPKNTNINTQIDLTNTSLADSRRVPEVYENNNNNNINNNGSNSNSNSNRNNYDDQNEFELSGSSIDVEEEDINGNTTFLETGMSIKVWKIATRKWRTAKIVSIESDHTLTVEFRDGSVESGVNLERVGLKYISHYSPLSNGHSNRKSVYTPLNRGSNNNNNSGNSDNNNDSNNSNIPSRNNSMYYNITREEWRRDSLNSVHSIPTQLSDDLESLNMNTTTTIPMNGHVGHIDYTALALLSASTSTTPTTSRPSSLKKKDSYNFSMVLNSTSNQDIATITTLNTVANSTSSKTVSPNNAYANRKQHSNYEISISHNVHPSSYPSSSIKRNGSIMDAPKSPAIHGSTMTFLHSPSMNTHSHNHHHTTTTHHHLSPRLSIRTAIGRDYRVTFTQSPLGLTLISTTNMKGFPTVLVSKIIPDGHASQLGVYVNDILIGIENQWIDTFETAMQLIKSLSYPISFVFRRQEFIDSPIHVHCDI